MRFQHFALWFSGVGSAKDVIFAMLWRRGKKNFVSLSRNVLIL